MEKLRYANKRAKPKQHNVVIENCTSIQSFPSLNSPIAIANDAGGSHLIEVLAKVPAGFPSPAQDHTQKRIDLNDVLVLNPIATFLFQVEGDSMVNARIFGGDRLIADRSVEAAHGRIVLACVDDEFTV